MSESEGKDRSENERQLVALVKRAQEEQDELLLIQVTQLHSALSKIISSIMLTGIFVLIG